MKVDEIIKKELDDKIQVIKKLHNLKLLPKILPGFT